MMRRSPAPSERAASTYSRSRSESVWPRTTRPTEAHEKNAITKIEIHRPGPTIETSAIAKSRNGNDSTTSISRASSVSTMPPK